MIFQNENILKLILKTNILFEIRKKLSIISNKLLYKLVLSLVDYKHIYESMGKRKHILSEHSGEIYSVTFLPNDNLVSVSKDNTLKVWDMNNFVCTRTLKHDDPVISVILLNDGNIGTCTWFKHIKIFSVDDNFKCLRTICVDGFDHYDNLIELSNGHLACSARQDNDYCILILDNFNDYTCIEVLRGHVQYVLCFANLPQNKFASGSRDTRINIWDINNDYNQIVTLRGHRDWVLSLLVIPDKDMLLSGSMDETIKVWNIINYDCIKTVGSQFSSIRSLLLLLNGYFAAGYWCGSIKIWNLDGFDCVNTLEEHQDEITSLLLMKDGRIISASADSRIIIWYY
jgi:WD40 repeat protein